MDAERHRRDAPRYCPGCAAALSLADGGQGLITEYWTGQDRVFVCYCGACGWSGDIVLAARVVGHEAEDCFGVDVTSGRIDRDRWPIDPEWRGPGGGAAGP